MEKLEFKEKIKLEAYKEKISNLILMWGGGSFVLLLIVCFIPMGLLPRKRRVTITNSDLSIFESIGFLSGFFMVLIISGLITLFLYKSYKYNKISKDVLELEKVTLKVRVTNIIYKQGGGPQEIDLYFSPSYNSTNKVEFIGKKNFPKLHKNQEIELILTKNALYPLMIKPKNELSDINDIMRTLEKIKNQAKYE